MHKILKGGVKAVANAVAMIWGKSGKHVVIDRGQLTAEEPKIVTKTVMDGLQPAPAKFAPKARDPDPKCRGSRAAHSRDPDSGDSGPPLRDNVLATIWCWVNLVNKGHVDASYEVTGFVPFNPDKHLEYTEEPMRNKVKAAQKVGASIHNVQKEELAKSSPILIEEYPEIPSHPIPPTTTTKRAAKIEAKRMNGVSAVALLVSLLLASVRMSGAARLKYLCRALCQWQRRQSDRPLKEDLLQGGGGVVWADGKTDGWDRTANQKKGRNKRAKTMNCDGKEFRCGRLFDAAGLTRGTLEMSVSATKTIKKHEEKSAGRETARKKVEGTAC